MAETTALQAKMKLDTTEVKRTGTLEKGYKVTGISGSGTLKLNKVTFHKEDFREFKKRKSNKSNDHHKPGRSRSIWSRKNSLR